MALRRLSTSSIQTNGKSSKLWDQTTFQSGMFALATVTLTSAAASVTFSGIPADYKHLQIRCIARVSSTASYRQGVSMRVNGDSTGPYSFHRLWGFGSTPVTAAVTSGTAMTQVAFATDASSIANSFAPAVIDILDYTTTKSKVTRTLTGYENNATGGVGEAGGILMLSNAFYNESPITSLVLYPDNAANFVTNSSFALYGIKGA